MSSVLEVKNLHKDYGENHVLKDISFTLQQGEILGIIGPSGSGKSTLLKCISNLEKATKGKVIQVNDSKQQGIVFQDLHLWPHRTILENIVDSLVHVKKEDKAKAKVAGKNLLQQFNLEEKESHYPEQLSRGQQQRVAIARSLAIKPRVLLLDEITSSLDPILVHELLLYMQLLRKQGISMIIVSHHLEFIKHIVDHVIFLENGTIIEEGKPEQIFTNPKHTKTKEFVEKVQLKLPNY